MNFNSDGHPEIPTHQIVQMNQLITRLFQCCQERMQYQSDRFALPDAELRCLLLFGEERYLTPKGIALRMNVVKSRVSRVIDGLIRKRLIQRLQDPGDSRVSLLSLTPAGNRRLLEIREFQEQVVAEVLRQIAPEQRKTMLTNLELLKGSMEAVKEMMT